MTRPVQCVLARDSQPKHEPIISPVHLMDLVSGLHRSVYEYIFIFRRNNATDRND